MNSPEEDISKTLLQNLANAAGAEFEDERLALEIIELTLKAYHLSQLDKVSDNQIIDHIENNCRSEKSETIMNEQEFYEGAKWCRDFLKNQ